MVACVLEELGVQIVDDIGSWNAKHSVDSVIITNTNRIVDAFIITTPKVLIMVVKFEKIELLSSSLLLLVSGGDDNGSSTAASASSKLFVKSMHLIVNNARN